jgi:hypothetical protein
MDTPHAGSPAAGPGPAGKPDGLPQVQPGFTTESAFAPKCACCRTHSLWEAYSDFRFTAVFGDRDIDSRLSSSAERVCTLQGALLALFRVHAQKLVAVRIGVLSDQRVSHVYGYS